ncbi:MAG: RNA polymerase sigma factor [Actinomycetia bacterium]|nr:RNA polymerase sigma factor [Actinomycetes bacterium]
MDTRSIETIYGAHAQEMVRFAAGLVGPDDAPDVAVDAFVRLVGSSVWNEARDRRALWYRAITFEARSWKRSAARRRIRETAVVSQGGVISAARPDPDEQVIDALDRLSPQQRAIIMLTYWADLDPGSVAERLGVSEGSVRKQLARARKKLKGELDHG